MQKEDMRFHCLFILIFLTGCGDSVHDDARFHPIRDQFVKDAKIFGYNVEVSKVRISFGSLEEKAKLAGVIKITKKYDHALAFCMDVEQQIHNDILRPMLKLALPKTSRLKVIVVRDDLQNQTAEFLESLVYHELGHCVLGRPHLENESIMSSSGVDSLTGFRYFYLKELFTHHSMELNTIFGLTKIDNSLELIYQVDYVAFNQRIFHQLFYNHQLNQYFDNENPDLL